MNTQKLYTTLLSAFFFALLTFNISAQESKTQTPDFLISVEKINNSIAVKCLKGCDWPDLKLNVNTAKTQALDEFGKKDNSISDNRKQPNLANFLITVEQTGKGIALKGIEGTTWNNLNLDFEIQKAHVISAKGVLEAQ